MLLIAYILFPIFFICTNLIGRDLQELINSGEIKTCFMGETTLELTHKELQNLIGLENIPGIETVKVIDASNNQIKKITAETFIKCTQLEQLILNNNQLEDMLTSDTLKNLTNLRELHIKHNNLWVLDLNNFDSCRMLYVLNVGFNKINNIIPKKIGILDHLEVLYLNNNILTELPSYAFSSCPDLQALYLQNNTLNKLQINCFSGLKKLRLLYLQDNLLTKLSTSIFSDLNNLHILYLRNNALKELEVNWHIGLNRLHILDLSYNELNSNIVSTNIGHVIYCYLFN